MAESYSVNISESKEENEELKKENKKLKQQNEDLKEENEELKLLTSNVIQENMDLYKTISLQENILRKVGFWVCCDKKIKINDSCPICDCITCNHCGRIWDGNAQCDCYTEF